MARVKEKLKLNSMTGFGRGSDEASGIRVICEVRTLNHKGLDIRCRIPQELYLAEGDYHQLLRQNFVRGRIELYVDVQLDKSEHRILRFDKAGASLLLSQLKDFAKNTDIKKDLALSDLLRVQDLYSFEENSDAKKKSLSLVQRALSKAVADALKARKEEGAQLYKIVESSLSECHKLVEFVKGHLGKSAKSYHQELKQRVSALVDGQAIDEARLAQEVAQIILKVDIAEEVSRLGAHLMHFEKLMKKGGAVGRKLDFLCQEMFREANTASNKVGDPKVTLKLVDLKAEIERIREQVQNIE